MVAQFDENNKKAIRALIDGTKLFSVFLMIMLLSSSFVMVLPLAKAQEPDTTAPVIFVPTDIVDTIDNPDGKAEEYTASAVDDIDGPIAADCSPESGSIFPVGVSTVECNAIDSSGNQATASFAILIELDAPEEIPQVGPSITSLTISSNPTNADPILTATATDSGSLNIAGAEFFVGTQGADGTGSEMLSADGAFDGSPEDITVTIPITGLDDGENIVFVHAKNTDGVWGDAVSVTCIVDTQPPTSPIIDPPTAASTNDTTPTISGIKDTDTSVTLYDTDGTTIIGRADGITTDTTWSIDVSELSNGTHVITAISVDGAGNISPPSEAISLVISDTDASSPSDDSTDQSNSINSAGSEDSTDNDMSIITPTNSTNNSVSEEVSSNSNSTEELPSPVTVESATDQGEVTFASDNGTIVEITPVSEDELATYATNDGNSIDDILPDWAATNGESERPVAVEFPYGFFAWSISNLTIGQTVTLNITLPDPLPVGSEYWEYVNGVWVDATSLIGSNDGDSEITLTITDGGFGDTDGVADGVITDPGGVGSLVSWVRQFGTSNNDIATAAAADATGFYVAGYTAGAITGTNAGGNDLFVRKYDTANPPNIVWTKQYGFGGNDRANAIAVDSSGVYVAGQINCDPGGCLGGYEGFARKYSLDGNTVIWTEYIGGEGSSTETINAIAVDGSGVYVAGETNACALSGVEFCNPTGTRDAIVRKYTLNGDGSGLATLIWQKQFGTTDHTDVANALAVDSTGVYVAGITTGDLAGQVGSEDGFIRKYSLDGSTIAYTKQFGTTGVDTAYALAVDSTGLYVAGLTSSAFPGQTSDGGDDAYVRKYDLSSPPNGVWTQQFGTGGNDAANSLDVDSSGVYVTGSQGGTAVLIGSPGNEDVFIQKFSLAAPGTALFARTFNSGDTDIANAVVAVSSTRVYIAGLTAGDLAGHIGGTDAFAALLDTTPPLTTATPPGGIYATSQSVSLSSTDNVTPSPTIYYTTDGSFPTTSSPQYTGTPITINSDTNLRFFAVDDAGNQETTKTQAYRINPRLLTKTQFGTTSSDIIHAVVVDPTKTFTVVVGETGGNLAGSSGGTDAFVRMYGPTGSVVWTRQFGSTSTDIANAVAIDSSGIYITGSTTGSFSGFTGSGPDVFVRKYDNAGNLLWTQQFSNSLTSPGGARTDVGNAIAVDSSGVYVAGLTTGAFTGFTNPSIGTPDAFIRKYSLDGTTILGTRQFGTTSQDIITALSIDSSGIYMAGYTGGNLAGSSGGTDAFAAKITSDLSSLPWTRQFGTSGTDQANALSVSSGGVYITGLTNGAFSNFTNSGAQDVFIRQYDINGVLVGGSPTNSTGPFIGTVQLGTIFNDVATSILVNSTSIYVAGYTGGSMGSNNLNAGGEDVFIFKRDFSEFPGTWIQEFGTIGTDHANGIALDRTGLYIAGYTSSSLVGTSAGNNDAFLIKLDTVPPTLDSISATPTIISPANGDGISDVETLHFNSNEAGSYQVNVFTLNGIRTITGSMNIGSNNVVWDGKDASNAFVADGNYNVRLQNVSDTKDNNEFVSGLGFFIKVDNTAPDTSITAQPSDPSNDRNPSFSFDGTDSNGVASFECQLDGGLFTVCASPQTYGGLFDGSHTFRVRAVDTPGNADSTPALYTWSISSTQPIVSITDPTEGGFTGDNTPTITGTASAASGFNIEQVEVSIDGGSYQLASGTTSWSFDITSPLSEGSHTVIARATDDVSNVDNSALVTFTVDMIAPTISAISDSPDPFSPNGDGIKDTTTISFTSDEAGFYTVMILTPGNGPVQNLTGAMVAGVNNAAVWDGLKYDTTAAPDGVYKYIITAGDAASNLRSAPGGIDGIITLDTTAPPAPVILNPGNGTSTSDSTPLINGTVAANFLAKFGNGNYKGITLDPTGQFIYVISTSSDRVEKYSLDGTLITQWGSPGSGPGQFEDGEADIAVDSSGNVYVVDQSAGGRLQKFASDGTFITQWNGTEFGGFFTPTGIAVGPDDSIYVVEINGEHVDKFTSSGSFVLRWGGGGIGDGQFRNPEQVAVDSAGYVYVADRENNRIQKFASDGTFVAKWGSLGSGPGQFKQPWGIAVDPLTGNIYVGDLGNGRIQILDPNGNFVAKFGSAGFQDGQLVLFALDMAVHPETGKIYVVDGQRIQVFEPDYGQASVEIFDGGTSLGTFTTDPSSTWSLTPSTPLSDGLHMLTAKVTDAAGNTSPPNGHIEFTISTTASPSITLELDNTNPPWGVNMFANVTVTGAGAGDYVVVSKGDGQTFTYPAFTGSFSGQLDLSPVAYDSSEVGGTFSVNATLFDSSDTLIATSNIVPITVDRRPSTLTLHLPTSVVNGTIFTASGDLADGLTGQGLAGKTITFNTLLGISLGDATTAGIDVQDAAGIDIVSCNVPQCTADNPNADSVNLLKLHPGATMSLPPGVTAAAFTLQDIGGGTVTVHATRSDGSPFDATSKPAGDDLATFVLSARDATHPNQYLQSIEVTSATGGLFSTSKIELYDADADPTTLVSASFDYFAAQSYGTTLTIAPGSYYSSALAPVLILSDIPVSAHFAGNSLYYGADTPDQSFETELGVELDSAGIGGTEASYKNQLPNFTTITCSAQDSDSDGDGLCDNWEAGSGIPYACGATTCNYVLPSTTVPVLGTPQTTSKLHKDIFVQVDAMDGQGPSDGALKLVVDAFAAAPVTNPDGSTGITLHIIKGDYGLQFVGKLDNSVPAGSRLFYAWNDPVSDRHDNTNNYFGIKSQHFGTADMRSNPALLNAYANAVRYALFVSTIGDSSTSGVAEDLGNDMIVSLGAFGGSDNPHGGKTGSQAEQAGAFMHELGHLLNLKHGGPAEIIAKIGGAQSNSYTPPPAGYSRTPYPWTTSLDGYTFSTMGPGSGTITLQQVVQFGSDLNYITTPTISAAAGADSRLSNLKVVVDQASTANKKIFDINYDFNVPYMDPTQGIDYATDFGSTKYLQAANKDVYDVSTQDFWMAGMFKQTGGAGTNVILVDKRVGITANNTNIGYYLFINTGGKLIAGINDGSTNPDGTPKKSITTTWPIGTPSIESNKWYAYAVSVDRDGSMVVYLYDVSSNTLYTSKSAAISTEQGSLSNSQIYTIAAAVTSATNNNKLNNYFPGQMDNIIPPQIGQPLPRAPTASDFQSFVTTGTFVTPAVKYNFDRWDSNAALTDEQGNNPLTAASSSLLPAFVPNTTVPMADNSVAQITIPKLTISFGVSPNVNIVSFGTPAYPTLSSIIPPDIATNCKPNYESVMSYSRELPRYLSENGEYALDYSRGNYAPLVETNLIEGQGVFSRDGLTSHNAVMWGSPSSLVSQVQKGYSYGPGQIQAPIDWSADGIIAANADGSFGTVQANVLNLSIDGCNPADLTPTTLHDYNDWNNVKLNWKLNALGTFDGVTRAPTKAATELTEETDEQMKAQVTTVQIDTLTDDKILYGESVSITGSSTNAPENAILLIDWGDGTSEQFEGAVDPVTGAWPVDGTVLSHYYGSDGVGERRITASLLDGSHEELAISPGTTVFVQDITAPILSLPADFVVEATGHDGAAVTYEVSAEDEVDGPLDVVCTPESGSTLPLGTTDVECSATDSHDNIGSSSFTVEVQDNTPPTITATDISTEATAAQTPVAFTVTAYDLVDGPVPVTCDPTSGSGFSLGTHTVDCSATDLHGNTAHSSFMVTVTTTRPPPSITKSDIVTEATGPAGAIVLFEVSATDSVDHTLAVSCDHTSGSTFPLGSTIVHCSATNSVGLTSTSSFNIIVQDTIPPAITVPDDKTVLPTSPSGAIVTYMSTASDIVDGSIAPLCTPASGSTFAIGTTTVTCTATDAHGNVGSATFHLTVLTQSQAVKSLSDLVDSMNLDKGTTNSLKSKLNAAFQSLATGDKTTAKNQLSAFINEVNAQTGKKITPAQASQLVSVAQNIIRAIG